MSELSNLRKQSRDISAIREFLDYPETFQMKTGISIPPDLTIPYQIELQDVSFHYPKSRRNILSHINLTIRAGENLAVVGLNGTGKTTLIKLICGFLDPTEGKVLLNNVDIRAFNRQDYYRLFSAVFQKGASRKQHIPPLFRCRADLLRTAPASHTGRRYSADSA